MKKYLKFLLKFFRFSLLNIKRKPPKTIAKDEILVRVIVKPLMFNKKLTPISFLPPANRGRSDVSVLRHQYTNTEFCKNHGKNLAIPNNNYIGFAIIMAKSIAEVNKPVYTLSTGENLKVHLEATGRKNLEMHADIIYSHCNDDQEPKTFMRAIALDLIAKSIFIEDKFPEDARWFGQNISHELFTTNGKSK